MPRPRTIREEIQQHRPFASVEQEAVIALLRTASDAARRVELAVAQADLTQPQYNVLRILRGANQPLPTMAVAERMVTPTPGITRLLDRLETSGFIERTPCGEDRRRMLCAITKEGLAVLDRLDPAIAEAASDVMGRLDTDDMTTLLHLLDEVREGIRAAALVAAD